MAGALLLSAMCTVIAWAQSRSIEGTYRNPALGYSIKIPRGLKGVTGDQAGPERGVGVSLPSGGVIGVFGEPNSAEYKTAEEGMRAELNLQGCKSPQQEVKRALVGGVKGAKGRLVCGERVLIWFLAFRTGGGPIYWLSLTTDRDHEVEDAAVLETIAASFKLIRWN